MRRQHKVAEYIKEGWTQAQIAESWRLAPSTIHKDAQAVGLAFATRKTTRPGLPPPYDWLTRPPPPVDVPPDYERSGPMMRLTATLQVLRDTNARNRFAFNVDAARRAGDEAAFTRWQVTLTDLRAYLDDLIGIAADPRAQAAAKLRESRDDQVKLVRGSGEMPTRVHAAVWQVVFSGRPLTPEVIGLIARGQNTTTDRVEYAIEDLKAAGVV